MLKLSTIVKIQRLDILILDQANLILFASEW